MGLFFTGGANEVLVLKNVGSDLGNQELLPKM